MILTAGAITLEQIVMPFPDTLTPENRSRLGAVLLECDCLKTPEARKKLIDDLPKDIRDTVARPERNDEAVDELVKACLNFAGGIESLLDRVRVRERDTALPWISVRIVSLEISVTQAFQLTQNRLDELRRILEQAAARTETFLETFQTRYGESGFPPGSHPHNAYEAFLILADEFGLICALSFLKKLSHPNRLPEIRPISEWITKTAENPEMATELTALSAQEQAFTYLLIMISPNKLEADQKAKTWMVDAWQWRGQPLACNHGPFERGEIEKAVREIVRLVKKKQSDDEDDDDSTLMVELIVPRELFSMDLTKWKISLGRFQGTLVRQHPVVFRWLDRIDDPGEYRKPWKRKWKALQNVKDCLECEGLKWLASDSVCTPDELIDQLVDPARGLCLALGFELPDTTDEENDLLTAALAAGTPVALWVPEPDGELQDLKVQFRELCQEAKFRDLVKNRKLTLLPQHIWDLRKAAAKEEPLHPGHHLAILYDDATRVPPLPETLGPPKKQ